MTRRLLVTGGSGFIGSNLIDVLVGRGEESILNFDLVPPEEPSRRDLFRHIDMLEKKNLTAALHDFDPTHVVHLAGRTDMDGTSVNDYATNHIGAKNLISAMQGSRNLQQVVFTSSQFVVGPGVLPRDAFDYRPHTIYGQSKMLSEQAIWRATLPCTWTIIRPTNIWGPKHPRYPHEFWRVVKQGRYLHPGGSRARRCYGYVGNVVEQVLAILAAPRDKIDRKVFYVGDEAIELIEWTNAFSRALTGKPVRILPRVLMKTLALAGDAIVLCGGKPPLHSSRFRSMTQDYLTPMDPTFEVLGTPPISLEQGVRNTVEWLRRQDPFWGVPPSGHR